MRHDPLTRNGRYRSVRSGSSTERARFDGLTTHDTAVVEKQVLNTGVDDGLLVTMGTFEDELVHRLPLDSTPPMVKQKSQLYGYL